MRLGRLLATSVAVALLAAGCGGDGEPEPTARGFNDTDVAFATEMIPHHAQALSMVDLVADRRLSRETEQLAEQIRAAQAPEIEALVDLLQSWDQPVPETMRDHANAHGSHGGSDLAQDMPGMMTSDQMDALEGAPDGTVEELFLEMMVEHHEGAVQMARTEQAEGVNEKALRLARQIERAQTREISRMKDLLAELG